MSEARANRSAQPSTSYCVVTTACSSSDQAETICAALLDQRLAACVQVLDITSTYLWKGQRETEPEKLLIIKTRADLFPALEAALRAIHPYETPEILALPVLAGSSSYLVWIDEVTWPGSRTDDTQSL